MSYSEFMERKPWKGGDWDNWQVHKQVNIAISKNFISYAGKYTVEDDKIIHNIMVSFVPNLMEEKAHTISFLFSGNKLITMSQPIHRNGHKISITLTWERVI